MVRIHRMCSYAFAAAFAHFHFPATVVSSALICHALKSDDRLLLRQPPPSLFSDNNRFKSYDDPDRNSDKNIMTKHNAIC